MCVCVYPCKQFVVVTIRRTGPWNTIPTLGTHLYRTLTRSTGIFYLRFIVWFLERTIILEDNKKKQSPSEQISSLSENSLESITIQSNPHSASTVAALLNDIHSGGGSGCYYPKSRGQTKQNISIFKEEVHFLRSKLHTNTEKKRKKTKRNNNIKTMTHHRMGFTPSSSSTTSSSSSSTTKPSAITTKKSPQRACLGGMVITPCEKCTIRTYVSLYPSLSLSVPSIMIITLTLFHFFPLPFPSPNCISYLRP